MRCWAVFWHVLFATFLNARKLLHYVWVNWWRFCISFFTLPLLLKQTKDLENIQFRFGFWQEGYGFTRKSIAGLPITKLKHHLSGSQSVLTYSFFARFWKLLFLSFQNKYKKTRVCLGYLMLFSTVPTQHTLVWHWIAAWLLRTSKIRY